MPIWSSRAVRAGNTRALAGFQIQLTAHIIADILIVTLLMTPASGCGGMGLLLVISIASGGLVGSGRMTLLYAAMASIALLLQHGFSILGGSQGWTIFSRSGCCARAISPSAGWRMR